MPHHPLTKRCRSASALAATVLAAVVLAACGPAHQDDVTPQRFLDPPTVGAEATEIYGERAEQAYQQAADLLLEQSYVRPLIDPRHTSPTASELSEGIVQAMSPEAAEAWTGLVQQDLAGDEEARDVVRLLRFHSWEEDRSQLAASGDPVRFQTVTEGEVDVDTDGAGAASNDDSPPSEPPLVVSLVHRAEIRLEEARAPYDVVITKPLTLTMVPDPDQPDRWLLADFEGTLEIEVDDGEPVPTE